VRAVLCLRLRPRPDQGLELVGEVLGGRFHHVVTVSLASPGSVPDRRGHILSQLRGEFKARVVDLF
jgi:hypothetical protein